MQTLEQAATELMRGLVKLGELWPEPTDTFSIPGEPFTIKFKPEGREAFYVTISADPSDESRPYGEFHLTILDTPPSYEGN